MTTYPGHREADVVLRDGSTVHVRPARSTDAPAVEQLLKGLSDRSRWLRFFSGFPNLDKAVQWATEVDYERRYGLVATTGTDGRVVGHAGFERQPDHPGAGRGGPGDRRRHAGQGARHDPARPARRGGQRDRRPGAGCRGAAPEPPDDQGVPRQRLSRSRPTPSPGCILVEFPTSLSPEALERFERREQVAATAAMRCLPGTAVGRGDRCLPAARHRRRRAVPQPAGGRVQRPGLPGQPQGRGGPVGPGLHVGPGGARPGRPGRAGRARAGRRRGRPRLRRQGRAGHRGHLGRVRRDRAGGRRAPAGAARGLPGRRDAADRAQLPRRS